MDFMRVVTSTKVHEAVRRVRDSGSRKTIEALRSIQVVGTLCRDYFQISLPTAGPAPHRLNVSTSGTLCSHDTGRERRKI